MDVLTLLAAIGGLHKALFALGLVIVGMVAQKIFMSDIIHKIYQIRKYENVDSIDIKKGKETKAK
jgi:hypothetical protein